VKLTVFLVIGVLIGVALSSIGEIVAPKADAEPVSLPSASP
jgi:hypothetical protein